MSDHEQERADRPASHALRGDEPAGDLSEPSDVTAPGQEPSTGDASVDEALRALEGLDAEPLGAHVAAFDAVHGALQDRLAEAQG